MEGKKSEILPITENSFKEFCYKSKKRNGPYAKGRSRVNKDIFQDGRITAYFYANESGMMGTKKYPEDRDVATISVRS